MERSRSASLADCGSLVLVLLRSSSLALALPSLPCLSKALLRNAKATQRETVRNALINFSILLGSNQYYYVSKTYAVPI